MATPGATPATGYRAGPIELGSVTWATGVDPATGGPTGIVDRFEPDAAAIVAALPIAQAPAGTRLRADWTYNNTPLNGLSSEAAVVGDGGGRWATFTIDIPDGQRWPAGSYAVAISVDGTRALEASVALADQGA